MRGNDQRTDDYCALPLSSWQTFFATPAIGDSKLQQFFDTAVVYKRMRT